MASWSEVQGFLEKTYNVQKKEGDLFVGTLSYNDGRSQLVYFHKETTNNGGKVWLVIDSPIGEVTSKDILDKAMDFIFENGACGGLIKIGSVYAVRHSVPIDDLSADEVTTPVGVVCAVADTIEEKFIGGDKN